MARRMRYYEVLVSSPKYHRDAPLTYSFDQDLKAGSLVTVPLQQRIVPGVVVKEVDKPDFAVKDIVGTISPHVLPKQLTELMAWIRGYYPASMGLLMSLALPAIITKKNTAKVEKVSVRRPADLPSLTEEQVQTLQKINSSIPKPVLLHGDTGTGKTRVYLELIRKAFAAGKSAFLLTPEIGLTPQLALTCEAAFPGQTVVVHSDLSPRGRRQVWFRILESSEPLVVLGPRSALFVPLKNIGLVVVDEFHETSYKQEQAPHYVTSRVAARLASLHGAQLVLGSATPPVTDYYTFREKGLPILRMTDPPVKRAPTQMAPVVLDLKKRELFNRSPWLADKLLEAIEHAHKREEQSLIFLNRRGTARLVLCSACGWRALCPHCDLALTYHGDEHLLRCHTCGYHEKTPLSCQVCGKKDILFKAIGTKSLVAELQRIFPDAIIQRFDSDSSKSESLEQNYGKIKDGEVTILVGTQMLGKGLDLPRLSVLGVIYADTSLAFPDYTAEERTFQLLTQVIGRVNRGHTPGRIFIQTHLPGSPLLKAAIDKDYASFYTEQLSERKSFGFPPFRFVMKLTCSYSKVASAKHASEKLVGDLRSTFRTVEIIGPSPAFIEKKLGRYSWQIIIKATRRSELIKIIQQLPAHWTYDIDPINLL